MNVDNFKIFNDLVLNESFSRAAKLNKITQSAVSQQLRVMEKNFGVLILDRSQKHFRLTREGERIYQSSLRMVQEHETLMSELQEMKNEIAGNIHVSTIYSLGLHQLPWYVSSFMKKFPDVNIRVEYRRANNVYEDIIENAADIGIVAYPIASKHVRVIPFKEERLVLICSPEHRFKEKKKIAVSELSEESFVAFDKDIPTRKATDELLQEAHIFRKPVMEFDNIETVKRAVEINAGVSIVPETTIAQEVSQGSLCKLEIETDRKLVRPTGILLRQNQIFNPALKNFIALLSGDESILTTEEA